MQSPTYKGTVRGGTVVLDPPADLADGAEVIVTPVEHPKGSPQAILAAMETLPHISPEDAEELMRLIKEAKQPARFDDLFDESGAE